jgi:hypothetical protein
VTQLTDETPGEKEARRFFAEALGLTVTRAPASASMSADFLVNGENPGYALEVKSRLDDVRFLKELRRGCTEVRSRSLGHDRWTEDNARRAQKQLKCADPARERFWVLWFAVECFAATAAMFSQVIGTLYGVRQVVYWDEPTKMACGRECLFAVPGVFEKRPEIDGAIVTARDAITLCVNEFSERAPSFQTSRLYQAFQRLGGPVRPSDLESNHGFLSIADRMIDRSNKETVARYLSQRYGLDDVYILDIKAHSASAIVPGSRSL